MIARTLAGLAAGAVAFAASLAAVWPAATMFAPAAASRSDRPATAQALIVQEVLSGESVVLVSPRTGPHVTAVGTVTVRLIGIDAPNFPTNRECYAEESYAALTKLLPVGSIAWVVTDEVRQDEGGRWLGYIWSSKGYFVNDVLLSNGIVRALDMAPNSAYWPKLAQSAEQAWRRGDGLWSACQQDARNRAASAPRR